MKLEIKKQHIAVMEREPLVSGTVNVYTAEFSFDGAWDGYTPVAVFESSGTQGKVSREMSIADGKCTIPWEVLLPGGDLRIGVYGVSGDKRLPTIYADSQFVARGTETAEEAAEPTPGVVEQFVAQVAADREAADQSAADAAGSAKASREAADRAEGAAVHQPYPDPETGTWWTWDPETGAYVDTDIKIQGRQGDSGLPDVVSVSGAEIALTLADNTEVRCTNAVTSLEITGFTPGGAGKAELWSLVFTAGETITVTLPDTVIWAVAEPVFTPGSTYWISWTPLYGKYLAVWTEVEANESTAV